MLRASTRHLALRTLACTAGQCTEEDYARLDPILRPVPGFFPARRTRAYPLEAAAAHLTGYVGEVTANMIAAILNENILLVKLSVEQV